MQAVPILFVNRLVFEKLLLKIIQMLTQNQKVLAFLGSNPLKI